jgi:hypothetical protein
MGILAPSKAGAQNFTMLDAMSADNSPWSSAGKHGTT